MRLLLAACLALATAVQAEEVVRADETLPPTRPEAWAMNYMNAATLMTSFGETPQVGAWHWQLAVDLGHVPRLSDEQRRVGFIGTKEEDLNKSPVFGRVRGVMGLPAGFVAEFGYTPPITFHGVKPHNLFAASLGRRVLETGAFSLSLRAVVQRGSAEGDITCPQRLAGAPAAENPFGCEERSNDRIDLDHYGADATVAWKPLGPWQAYANFGALRTDLAVQVDALTAGVRDRSLLTSKSTRRFLALGARYELARCWSVGAEVLHVPLKVQRGIDSAAVSDPFTGLRIQLLYRFG